MPLTPLVGATSRSGEMPGPSSSMIAHSSRAVERQLANLSHQRVDERLGPGELVARLLRVEPRHRLQRKLQAGERLPHLIVQLARETTPLAFLDLHDAVRQLHMLLHLRGE